MTDTSRADEEKRFWDRFASKYDRFMERFAGVYEEILDLIAGELEPGFVVLEVATGTGIIATAISDRASKVVATDISDPMIEVAREKAEAQGIKNVEFSVMDAYDLRFEDGAFDCCIVANALHVMKEPRRALSEVKRVLKPGGKMICPTFCHGENFKSRVVSRIVGIVGFKACTRFSVDSFRRFIEGSGFEIVDARVFKGVPPLVYLVARR